MLTGDLAFLHDSNGLLAAKQLRGSLTVVLINNDGGGIFAHLPVAQIDPPFERYFATPQNVGMEKLCEAHGVSYERVSDWAQFIRLVSDLPEAGLRILELRTDREADRDQLRDILSPEVG